MAGSSERKIELVFIGDTSGASKALKDVAGQADAAGKTADDSQGGWSHLSASLKELGGKAQDAGEKIGKIALTVGAATAGLAVAGGAAMLKLGSDFDGAYDHIQIGTGATGKALDGLKSDFKTVFSSVPVSMGEASTAITDFNKVTGATGKTLQDMSTTALNLSRMTKTDLATNIKGVVELTDNWGLKNEEVSGLMDKLFVASQKTGVSVEALSAGVTDSAATFRAMGLSVTNSIALVGSLGAAGIESTAAMAGITKAVGKFAKEGIDAKTGIQQTFDAIKNAKTPTEATALAVETFGAKAGPKLADSIRNGKFSVEELTKELGKSSGAINKTAKDTDDFGEKLHVLRNRAEVALEPVANKVFDLANVFVDKLTPAAEAAANVFVNKIIPAATAFADSQIVPVVQELASKARDLASAVGDRLGPMLQQVGTFFKEHEETWPVAAAAIGGVLTAGFVALGIAAASAAVSMIAAAAPILAVVAAAALLGAGIYELITHWHDLEEAYPPLKQATAGVQNVMSTLAAFFTTTLAPALVAVAGYFRDNFGAIQTIVTGAFTVITTPIKIWIDVFVGFVQVINDLVHGRWQQAWDDFENMVLNVWNDLVGYVKGWWGILSGLLDFAGPLLQRGKDWINSLLSGLMSAWDIALGWIKGLPADVLNIFWNAGDLLLQVGKDIVNGLWNGISGAWDGLVDSIGGLINKLPGVAKKLLGIGSPSKVFAEIGTNIAEGMANGITGGFNTIVFPAMSDAQVKMLKLAQDAKDKAVAAIGGPMSAGQTYIAGLAAWAAGGSMPGAGGNGLTGAAAAVQNAMVNGGYVGTVYNPPPGGSGIPGPVGSPTSITINVAGDADAPKIRAAMDSWLKAQFGYGATQAGIAAGV